MDLVLSVKEGGLHRSSQFRSADVRLIPTGSKSIRRYTEGLRAPSTYLLMRINPPPTGRNRSFGIWTSRMDFHSIGVGWNRGGPHADPAPKPHPMTHRLAELATRWQRLAEQQRDHLLFLRKRYRTYDAAQLNVLISRA